jgi:hypothetical protein
MATQEYAASIQGVSIRVTRLNADGTLSTTPGDSYTTSAFMRLSFTPEYEEGDEITEKGASGVVCVTYKSPDTLKRITMELAICEPDPELTNLISGGLLLRKNLGTYAAPENKSIGWAAPGVGDDPAGYGVAIEAWSNAIKDGKKDARLPYFHWVFPFAKLRQSGDRVIENGVMANTFQGYGLGNVQFGSGPDNRWEFPTAAERPYAYARSDWAPTGLNGFYTWSDGVADPFYVSNKALAANVATLTVNSAAVANPFAVGDQILVSGVDTTFNTTNNVPYTITNVAGTAGAWTLKFNLTATDVTSTPVTTSTSKKIVVLNPVTETVTYTPVTDFTGQSSGSSYNVPGNKDFNADNAIDRIIASNEDPTA